MSSCNAKRICDQMICGPCALQWDIDDPAPPKCKGLNGGRSTVLREVRRLEQPRGEPLFDAHRLVNDNAARTLSRADFTMCVGIAREAYARGLKDAGGTGIMDAERGNER